MSLPPRALAPGLLLCMVVAGPLAAQVAVPAVNPGADSSERGVELSGTLFTNYQYGGGRPSRSANRFELERAYLTARAKLSPRASVRVTADVFQQRNDARSDFYGGWVLRAKYAYLQYDFGGNPWGTRASGRIGMLPTVVIDQEEAFWPRWITNVALERAGFFSSADVGAAGTLTLPAKLGHVYATVTNGPGYQSREVDRFKDAGVRLTLTPFAGSEHVMLRTLAISPWVYKGARASDYEDGAGSLAPVSESRGRDRAGILLGAGDRSLTMATHFAQRREELESIVGGGPGDSSITVREATANVFSAFAIARPFTRSGNSPLRPLGLLVRYDGIEDLELGGDRQVVIAGLLWDVGPRLSFALDYQEQTLRGQPITAPSGTIAALDTRVYFLHAVVNF